ncbi:UDP-N-acetylglucosamine--N-acetylmuramyl-(pentapeptide) pyrophosphoryl-UDP N-acetylglucosamine transferase [Lampropedia cohaerens]|uniref:UDP-N-acetylglucosamine--N-acetylmuramyl-(pentapeptide) pyrophosphoryl-undecaprenol N-acetylglucosamine transferase n=1 Tax=Lampropedia cohaerens TaxID=1610491 RepID=A0A0U1PZ00_9BURK|nr:undecaprenyldiphospho-muramoylpentapeptide beta-N-acetylglucosaminyltransferase [Lampropedia cohaerens]KKW67744.1 UDP-N-acetylglucosamine--N-acetylmuramyl-(pentapeptide) pyrophosphoryl-UDP N-acetylglucosamine transferase [Lampropedia cohaerens]
MNARIKTALIMAGGTGGHIFPGIAVAQGLQQAGWRVVWLGGTDGMEHRLVPGHDLDLRTIAFAGVRGKGVGKWLTLPWTLTKAWLAARKLLKEVQPDVVLGFGGYICVPGGLAAASLRTPLVLHEQNAVAGMANKWLARLAQRVFTAFPRALPGAEWCGNPLREAFAQQRAPKRRYGGREGPLKLLVVGGSLGAQALNEIVPQALALIAPQQRPQVVHQGGGKQIEALRAHYAQAGVQAQLVPFIKDTARAYAEADLVLCRAGASTVTEIAAVGVAACFVPFPYAVDDHQTANARYLVDADAAWLVQQKDMTPASLADFIRQRTRQELLERAERAHQLAKLDAVRTIVTACEELAE